MKQALLVEGMDVAVKPAGAVGRRRTLSRRKATIVGVDPAARRAVIRWADCDEEVAVPYSRITGRWLGRPLAAASLAVRQPTR